MSQLVNRRAFSLSGVCALATGCGHGNLSPSTEGAADGEINRLVNHRILQQQAAYAVVAATLQNGSRRVFDVRHPAAIDQYALGESTIFEIASLTKVFTALLLAVEVVHGRMGLDDPVQNFMPAGVNVPMYDRRQISLLDLATHGSGLPLRPSNLAASAPDTPNKYADYALDELYAELPLNHLTRAPGSAFQYSNLGFALLGQAIALRESAPIADVLRARVLEPLGLDDTSFSDHPRNDYRRAAGHDFYLEPMIRTNFGALDPAGGLRSTASDLLTLLELFVNERGPRDLVMAARLMLSIDRPGDDAATRMALGWRRTTANGETYFWSNGSGDGSRTFMGFNPARHSGVVMLADAASGGGFDDIGRRFLDSAQVVDVAVEPWPSFTTLPDDILHRAIGRYELAPGDVLEITRGYTGLIVSAGAGQFVIRPQSPTRYASRMAPGLLFEFEGADTGPAQALILHQNGERSVYRRVS